MCAARATIEPPPIAKSFFADLRPENLFSRGRPHKPRHGDPPLVVNARTISPEFLPAPACEVSRWFTNELRPHEAALRAYLRRRFPGLPDPDDIVQEAYVRVLRMRETRTIVSPKSLLFVTARNVAVDQFRRRHATPVDDLTSSDELNVIEDKPAANELLSREQELQLLGLAVQSLPERCRQIIMLKKIEGLSYEEIGQRLGISRNTISAQLTIGITKCRDFLLARGFLKGGRP